MSQKKLYNVLARYYTPAEAAATLEASNVEEAKAKAVDLLANQKDVKIVDVFEVQEQLALDLDDLDMENAEVV